MQWWLVAAGEVVPQMQDLVQRQLAAAVFAEASVMAATAVAILEFLSPPHLKPMRG
jgi:hypothetical protein